MSENLSFLTGINSEYIAHLYAQYKRSGSSVDPSWKKFFDGLNDEEVGVLQELHGASWTPDENRREGNGIALQERQVADAAHNTSNENTPSSSGDAQQAAQDSIRAIMLIRAYRARGHLEADLDPLGLRDMEDHPELEPSHYGFNESDYDRPIFIGGVLGLETATLRQMTEILKETYWDKAFWSGWWGKSCPMY